MRGLDFWIGSWEATWKGGRGTSKVTRDMDGRVVTERFEALEPERFSGLSVSVLGPDELWRQTWVDSTGNYWHFEGGPRTDDSFELATPQKVGADQVYKRMVFSDIGPDRFSWRWEFSNDRSDWEQRWSIDYRRA